MKKAALVGIGRWGRRLAKVFKNYVNITSVVSQGNFKNINNLSNVLSNFKLCSIEDVLSDKSIEIVIVAVPIENLSKIAIKCLENNKHVFLEKPGACSVKDLELIKRKLNRNNNCFINYHYAKFSKLNNLKVDQKKIKFFWKKWGTFNNDIMLNLLTHELYIANYLIPGLLCEESKINLIKNKDKIYLNISREKYFNIEFIINRMSKDRQKKIKDKNNKTICDFYNTEENFLDTQCNFFVNNLNISNVSESIDVLKFIEKIERA